MTPADACRASFRPLVVAAAALLSGAAAPQRPDVSEAAIVRAGEAYVRAYQQQLTAVLADEIYRQEIVRQVPVDRAMPPSRTLRSELFFMFAPSAGWMAIRDVISVDGDRAPDRPDIKEALRTLPSHEVATTFKRYNSRFNLGRTFRNFNEPTLGLLVLDAEHRSRFSFRRARVEQSGDAVLVTVAFREKERPTLIRDLKAGPVFSNGELTIEAGTGRVRRTTLAAKIQSVRLDLTTQYAPDDRLGIWVPSRFREEYEYGEMRASGRDPFYGTQEERAGSTWRREYEKIVCEATYSNYRRFETSVRIK